MRSLAVSLLVLAACCAPLHAAAERRLEGTAPGGAAWVVVAPDAWQPGDGLVLAQHGFSFAPIAAPVLGPSAARMLADGYAVAASGYRQTGWAVFDALDDNVELLEIVRARLGEPGSVVVAGGSMGGFIALKLAEDDRIRHAIDGVLALCPAVDGVGTWDRAFDLRLAYDALCRDVPGGALPVGDAPFPWAANLAVLADAPMDPLGFPAAIRALPAVQACLALQRPAAQRDADAQARVAALMDLAGTHDEEQFAALMNYAVFGLADLVRSPDKLAGRNPFFNVADYASGGMRELAYRHAGDAALPATLDGDILRVLRDDAARLAFHAASSLDGSASARIVSIHTSGDGIVPAQEQSLLRRRFGHAPQLVGVAQETGATHCGFSGGEYDAAWDTLHAWLDAPEAMAPTLADLQQHCIARADGACRFDPDATARALAGPDGPRRPPLTDPLARPPTTVGGLWFDPARPAQGILVEELDDFVGAWHAGEQRVAVSWYTWAPAADPQAGPRWFYGIGRVYERSARVQLLDVRNDGGPHAPWGTVDLVFASNRTVSDGVRLHYDGPPAYGRGELALAQLTAAGSGRNDDAPPPADARHDYARAGTYIDPGRPAGGWMLNQYRAGADPQRVASLIVRFTHDDDGRAAWQFGIDDDDGDGLVTALLRGTGGRFEPGYPDADVHMAPASETALLGCDGGSVQRIVWTHPTDPLRDAGDVAVARLTAPTLQASTAAACP